MRTVQAGMSGEHDEIRLTDAEAVALSNGFWGVVNASGYPAGYSRAVIRDAYDDFRADFAAASRALVEDTEAYLGKAQPQRRCSCADCKAGRGEAALCGTGRRKHGSSG